VDLAKLGARTAVIGKVGNDVFADFIRRDLQEKGLDVSGIRVAPTAPTSRTVILTIIGQDRRYIHAVGANAELRVEDVDREKVAASRVLYVGGYLLFPGFDPESLAGLFRFAHERGVRTVLDVAGVNPEKGLEPLRPVLPFTDAFLPNNDEAELITGEKDPVRQAEALLDCGAGTVVITLGAQGAVAMTRDLALRAGAYRVNAIDPSGGGDAFDAGFIIGLLEGWDLRRTIEFASAIGASACTQLGCTAGVFNREQALAFMAENRIEVSVIQRRC